MSGLGDLERDLDDAADRMPGEAHKVVSKGALNIKDETRDTWKRRLRGGHLQRLAYSVGYDITSVPGATEITAHIGPDANNRRMQGALGGVAEYGTVNNAPIPALTPAHIKESPRFEDALGDLGERLLGGR